MKWDHVSNLTQEILQADAGEALSMHWQLDRILALALAWLHTRVMILHDTTTLNDTVKFISDLTKI